MTIGRKRLAAAVALVAVAALATLSARGMDRLTRHDQDQSCSDINVRPNHDEWPPSNCLEGHPCAGCSQLGLGETTTAQGNGDPLNQFHAVNCGGDRQLGTCVPMPHGDPGTYCDISAGLIDGVCGGNVVHGRLQPITPGQIAGQ